MKTLHPLSVPVRSLSRSFSTGSLFFFVGVFASPGGFENVAVVAAMVVFGILLGVGYELAYYRRFRYELTADTFDVTSGVLSRRNREVPLGRIQNVDVRQNVLQRALGIAAVHVETAGGGETEVTLQYVAESEANRLQRLLRNGPRSRAADRNVSETGDRTGTAPDEEVLFEIRPRELGLLSVFTIDPGASVLGGIALSFVSGFDPQRLVPVEAVEGDGSGFGIVAIAWAVGAFLLLAWAISAALTFSRYYGFRLLRVGDELHYERGLLQRYSGTIPLDKVQTLTIKESVPARWFGYGSLAVETAGYAPGQSGSRGTESAIPLAERGRVFKLARSVEPFGDEALESTPSRARERYAVRYVGMLCAIMAVGYVLATYTAVVDDWQAFAALLFVVPVAAHLKWRSRGYRAGDRYFLAKTGFWRRTTKVVPYYRVQSVVDTRTIFQRRRRLASVTADTASSASFFGRAATAIDVDESRGLSLQRTIADRLQERLRARKRERAFGRLFTRPDVEPPSSDSAERRDGDGAAGTEDGDADDRIDGDGSVRDDGAADIVADDGPADDDREEPSDADRCDASDRDDTTEESRDGD